MRPCALIPARGGSKRLPRKNVIDFLGKPMIAHTIGAALESGSFERVVVSTEDAEIAAVARHAGALVHPRPANLATDSATVSQVCLDFLDAEAAAGRRPDVFCCLFATAPLRNAADIRAVVGLVDPGRCDFALAVTTYDLPPHQALRSTGEGTLTAMFPDLITKRASEVGALVVDNGSTYAATIGAFREIKNFFGPGLRGHLMPRSRSVDLDEAEDLELLTVFAKRHGL